MNYALRLWMDDRLEDSFDTPHVEEALARFRTTVVVANNVYQADPRHRFFVTVDAEPGPYPARSFTLASYQQPGRAEA